ncbi:10217_t:CDS:2 [Entrophospora sp. SA101]|nr:6487_t:CDS:2 [Entrophospora sp. SA101]CAJ0890345.1 10217_t:CDS:2 [Entrophospora sp. SA101]CAJ0925558.1 19199_t:CDS:2 [Entrophospora sp. SA101]
MTNNHNILQYTEYLQDKNLSANTIRLYLNVLDKFPQEFNTANLKEYFRTNLKNYQATSLKTQQHALNSYIKFKKLELSLLKETKVEKNLAIHQRNNLILDFLLYSGLRINELVNVKHQDWQTNQLRILGKGNKVRFVLLPEFLIKHFNPISPNYLFTNQRGNPIKAEYIR